VCVRSVFWWRLLEAAAAVRAPLNPLRARMHACTHTRDLVHYLGVHNRTFHTMGLLALPCVCTSVRLYQKHSLRTILLNLILGSCAVCVCVTFGRGRRRKQLVDNLTETRGQWKLKWTAITQSVLRLTTGWTVRGSNPGGGEIFRTRPDRS